MSIDVMNLLNEVRQMYKMEKLAYVPSPAFSEEAKQPQQEQQPGSGVISSPEQAIQIIIQALQEGYDPNSIAQGLVQQGVPENAIGGLMEAAMNQANPQPQPQSKETPPPEPEPKPEPPKLRNISKEIESHVNEEIKEMKIKTLPVEERVDLLERELNKLIDFVQEIDNVVQQILANIPQKKASMEKVLADNKQIMDNDYELDEIDENSRIP